MSDADAMIIGGICRKLDGLALAIELAARRVEAYGLRQTADLLDRRLTLLWTGSRTATPRQRTLQATLDWSYGLLTDLERLVLRRLAVFVGHFTLDAALEVASSATLDQSVVFGAMDSLVAKSMVATRPIGAMMRYRLLDTTRAYALDIAIDDAVLADLSARHAAYYRRWLEQNGNEWSNLSAGTERAAHFAALDNIRAALEWAFGGKGDTAIGVELAATAAPVFLAMSLLPECHRWSERALQALDVKRRGGAEEMHLQVCLGNASLHRHGQSPAARDALVKGLSIADARGDSLNGVGIRSLLHMFHYRGAEFNAAMQNATQCRAIAGSVEDPAAMAVVHSILGRSLYIAGELGAARAELDALVALRPRSRRPSTVYLSYDRHYRAEIALARTLWLQGHPDQAAQRAHDTLREAERLDRPESLAVVLNWAAAVFLWIGDLQTATQHIASSIFHARSLSLEPVMALGEARTGELAVCQGDAEGGVKCLEAALAKIEMVGYELMTTEFRIALVQGLAALGRIAEAAERVDGAIRKVQTKGDLVFMPELLRVKADLQATDQDAQCCLEQSLDWSRRQGARALELRAATDLAARLMAQGRSDHARALLQPVFEQFTEGHEAADLKAAERLLGNLRNEAPFG